MVFAVILKKKKKKKVVVPIEFRVADAEKLNKTNNATVGLALKESLHWFQ